MKDLVGCQDLDDFVFSPSLQRPVSSIVIPVINCDVSSSPENQDWKGSDSLGIQGLHWIPRQRFSLLSFSPKSSLL
jgi:hypothetical protein